jgi:hypothetical protein
MSWDELGRSAAAENRADRDRWIGVYVGILAVLLAVCSMGGSNATKEATMRNIEASNNWSFFQAKNIRRTSFQIAADDLELILQANLGMPAEARRALEAKVKSYRDTVQRYTTDKQSMEGLDELWEKGKRLEAERNVAMAKDPYFDYGQALLQIAIVLASIALISGGNMLLVGSFLLAAMGALSTFNGFFLITKLAFVH